MEPSVSWESSARSEERDEAVFPASLWQARIWQEAQLSHAGAALHVAMRWRIEGVLSEVSLERALAVLVARHEILRTRFAERDGVLVQCVRARLALPLASHDLAGLPAAQQDDLAEQLAKRDAEAPFDLTRGPLLRASLVRRGPLLATLQLTFHQAIVDGWSIGILIDELGRLAAGFELGSPPALPEVDLHYGDYARWQRDMLESGALEPDLAYWRAQLHGAPRFELEPDHPRTRPPSSASTIRSVLLPRALTDALEQRARDTGQTLFSVVVSALAATLARITRQREVVIGTQVAGREGVHAERVVGPLINALVLRLRADTDATLARFAERTFSVVQDALEHQALPFEALVSALGERHDGPRTPLYAVNFVLQKAYIDAARVEDTSYGGFTIVSVPSRPVGILWDLNLFMVGRVEGWRLSCEVNDGLYEASTAEQLLAEWQETMARMVAAPETRLVDIALRPATCLRLPTSPRPPPLDAPSRTLPAYVPRGKRAAALEERIVPMHAEGTKTPVLVVNNTAVLYPLARALGSERPLYDLQFCPAETPLLLPYRDFRDLARDALEMIRLARPSGPYILMGLCVFGAIALEAARLLQEEGERVELVVLNDSWAPGFREALPWRHRQLRAWQVRMHNVTLDWDRYRTGQKSLSGFLSNYRLVRKLRVVEAASALGLLEPAPDADVLRLENRWFTDYLARSQARHRPAPYEGDVAVFRSQEPLTGRFFPRDLGWGPLVRGRLSVFDCPGMHAEMYREAGAREIAQRMREVLGDT